MGPDERIRAERVEPLFEALQEGTVVKEEKSGEPRPDRRDLMWKLVWVGIVFLGLLALVLKQAY